MKEYVVFDKKIPSKWEESVPVGNGRLGATLMCGVSGENMFLNEESIWSSHNVGTPNPDMSQKMQAVRQLLLEGKVLEANHLANEDLIPSCVSRIRSYENAGELRVGLHRNDSCGGYKHSLDLINGIAAVEYDFEGSHYIREYLASHPDNVIAMRVTSSDAPIDAWISYDRPHCISVVASDNELKVVAKTTFGEHRFCVKIRAFGDGVVESKGNNLHVYGGKTCSIYVSVATEFFNGEEFEDAAIFPVETDFDVIKKRHIEDFSALMKRAEIILPEATEMNSTPMSERMRLFVFDRVQDNDLTMLQWQFARYMLISSCREGTLPPNLQGLWTKGLSPEWSGDYHFNINLQANFWPCEVTNLSECHNSLFTYMNDYLLEPGKKTAEVAYKSRGAVVHHLSDIYGFTTPQGGAWGIWPHGLSWLCLHMWEHYLFTLDKDFLRNTAYNTIRQTSLFFLDTLVEDKKGHLVWGPSISPETPYRYPLENGETELCWFTMSAALDTQIIECLFNIYVESSQVLGISDDDIKAARNALSKLPPMKIGKYGQIMEWQEDYTEPQIQHHHLSPGFAAYPYCSINRSTPELLKAVEVMVDRRSNGGGSGGFRKCGWSIAWAMALYARMGLGEKAYSMIDLFQHEVLSTNLFFIQDIPTGGCFQLDGVQSFGAGVTEMLIQSHEGVIALVPALPKRWDHGSFRGLCARGGFEVDCAWSQHQVDTVTVKGEGSCVIELPKTQTSFKFADENDTVYSADDYKISLEISGSKTLTLIK